jgi:prevent-host-death family protein
MYRIYSITQAHNDLSSVVREAEAGRPVTLSRRGRPVAVVVSASEFAQLAPQRRPLAAVIATFRHQYGASLDDIDWVPARDHEPVFESMKDIP